MPSVQVEDVPPETHAVLRRRAAEAGQSLQEYLRSRLIEEASKPTLDEVLAKAAAGTGTTFTFEETVQALQDERAGR